MKRIVSLVLALTMLLECVPLAFAQELGTALAAPKRAQYESVWTQNGKTLKDQTLDGDLILDGIDLYIDGTLTFAGGGRLVVRSGHHRISRDAVIKGDIILDGSADLEMDGIVEGEIIIEQDESRWQDQWTSLHIGEHGVVRSLRAGLFRGDVLSLGSVSRMKLGTKGTQEMHDEIGWIKLSGNAFVGAIDSQGEILPNLYMEENALVSQMTMDGIGWLEMHGGYVDKANMKGSVDGHISEGMHVGELNVSDPGTWISIRGGKVDKVTLSNPSTVRKPPINEWYNDDHAVVTVQMGGQIGDVKVTGLSSFIFGNVDTDIADSFAEAPIASLDHSQFFKETVVNSIVTSGPVCIENHGYVRYIEMGKGADYWGSGKADVLKSRDSSIYMHHNGEDSTDLYHNRVRGMLNYDYYDSVTAQYAEVLGGNISVGPGCSVGTLIAERANVDVYEFESIDNLVLNRVRHFHATENGINPEGSVFFERKNRINRVFYNGSGYQYGHDGNPILDVGTFSAFEYSAPAMWDVEKLLLPNGKKTIGSALHRVFGDVVEGVRPEPEERAAAEDSAPAQAHKDVNCYVEQVVTTCMQNVEGLRSGGATAAKAKALKKTNYQIRKNSSLDWWYTVETSELQSLNLSMDANEGMGMLVVYGPDGQHEVLVSECDKADMSLISERGGLWTLRLIGAPNDYALKLGVTNPIRIDWTVNLQQADQKGNGQKEKIDLTALKIDVENKTSGTKPKYIVTPDAIVMTNDQAGRRDTLVLTVSDPEDAFIPKSAEIRLSEGKAKKTTTVYAYGGYRATCTDGTDVTMHLYDADGNYIQRFNEYRGVYTVDKLLPGKYQVVMIRGDVGRWRFAKLSDYADFGLEEKKDYRLDVFTLKEGYTDYYPRASVPAEPKLDSAYIVESDSRYAAGRKACLVGGSVLMRVEYALENTDAISEAYVEVQIGEGMSVQPEYVTLDGETVPATVENGFLRVPVMGHDAGQVAFYAFGSDVKEMLSIARLTLETAEGTQRAYLGFAEVAMKTLSIEGSVSSGGTVNLYGYGMPNERVTVLHNGAYSVSTDCDAEGRWYALLDVEATPLYTDHEFSVAMYARTQEELISTQTQTVRVHDSIPELESINLYYYEHEHLRKLELSAEEFYRGGLRYNYLPNSEFTCTVRFSNADRIEKLYYVQELADGRKNYLPCTYNPQADTWSVTSKFPFASMGANWRFEYELTPLPEPQLPDEQELLQRLENTEFDVQVTDFELTEDFEALANVHYRMNGEEIACIPLDIGITDDSVDLEYAAQNALQVIELEDGSVAYLMGSENDPESTYIIYVDPQEMAALEMRFADDGSRMTADFLRWGIFASARADAFDVVYETIVNVVTLGTTITALIASGTIGSVVTIFGFDNLIVQMCLIVNKARDAADRIGRMADAAESDERKMCLRNIEAQLYELAEICTKVVKESQREVAIEALTALIPAKAALKAGDIKGSSVSKFKDLKADYLTKSDQLKQLLKKVDDISKEIDKLKDSMSKNGKALLDKVEDAIRNRGGKRQSIADQIRAHRDALKKAGVDSAIMLDQGIDTLDNMRILDDMMVEHLDSILRQYQNGTMSRAEFNQSLEMAKNAFESLKADEIRGLQIVAEELTGVGQTLSKELAALDIPDALIPAIMNGEIALGDVVTVLLKLAEEYKNETLPQMNELEQLGDLIDQRDKLEKEKQDLEEQKPGMEEMLQTLAENIFGLINLHQKLMNDLVIDVVKNICQEIYDTFIKRIKMYNGALDDLVRKAEKCPPDPTPTPTPEPTPTPTLEPTPTPTPTVSTTPDPTPTPSSTPPGDDDTDDDGPGANGPGTQGPDNGDPDPSGYVYEGVWTNRIEGVTTTAYMMNDQGDAVMWDASLHGQENPLITDAKGYYEWYVPEGTWQVKYEKEGYETAFSEWLPVPPPQTEVHQGIISYAQPEMTYAIHYGDCVEIAFSKPVLVDSVNSSTVQIGTEYTAEAQNPEREGDSMVVLASVYRLYPGKALASSITVTVGEGVTSYAGVAAAAAEVVCECRNPLLGLETAGTIELKVGQPSVLNVRALGAGDYQTYALSITGSHEDILVVSDHAAFDQQGMAQIELMPVMPCTLTLMLSVDCTDIEMAVKVVVMQ